MKNAREIKIVERVLEILDEPKKWIKKRVSIDKDGIQTYPPSSESVCWCLDGAIYKALHEEKLNRRKWLNSYNKILKALSTVIENKYDASVRTIHWEFNDDEDTTYEMVIKAVKGALAHLKGETNA